MDRLRVERVFGVERVRAGPPVHEGERSYPRARRELPWSTVRTGRASARRGRSRSTLAGSSCGRRVGAHWAPTQ